MSLNASKCFIIGASESSVSTATHQLNLELRSDFEHYAELLMLGSTRSSQKLKSPVNVRVPKERNLQQQMALSKLNP